MVRYRRNFLPGGTFFFTVALADRRSTLLTDHISILRQAFRKARAERPFDIDAIVILPDHLHTIVTLPKATLISHTVGAASKPSSPAARSTRMKQSRPATTRGAPYGKDASGSTR